MDFMLKSTKRMDEPCNPIVTSKRVLANLIEITNIISNIESALFGDTYTVSEESEVDRKPNLDCVTGRLEEAVAETIQIIRRLSQLRDKILLV